MKILLLYLKPYKWLIALALFLATINQVFSMLDPYFFGTLIDNYASHPYEKGVYKTEQVKLPSGKVEKQKVFEASGPRTHNEFIWGVLKILGILIGVAMVSRIAKAFQDYFSNVVVQKFGACLWVACGVHRQAVKDIFLSSHFLHFFHLQKYHSGRNWYQDGGRTTIIQLQIIKQEMIIHLILQ